MSFRLFWEKPFWRDQSPAALRIRSPRHWRSLWRVPLCLAPVWKGPQCSVCLSIFNISGSWQLKNGQGTLLCGIFCDQCLCPCSPKNFLICNQTRLRYSKNSALNLNFKSYQSISSILAIDLVWVSDYHCIERRLFFWSYRELSELYILFTYRNLYYRILYVPSMYSVHLSLYPSRRSHITRVSPAYHIVIKTTPWILMIRSSSSYASLKISSGYKLNKRGECWCNISMSLTCLNLSKAFP